MYNEFVRCWVRELDFNYNTLYFFKLNRPFYKSEQKKYERKRKVSMYVSSV